MIRIRLEISQNFDPEAFLEVAEVASYALDDPRCFYDGGKVIVEGGVEHLSQIIDGIGSFWTPNEDELEQLSW